MHFLTGQNSLENFGLAGGWRNTVTLKGIKVKKYFSELLGQAQNTITKVKKKNKTAREVERIKIDLTILEEMWSRDLSVWTAKDIFASILVLETSTKTGKRIVTTSLKRKFSLLKGIFEDEGLDNFEVNKRVLNMALQEHIRQRIDNSATPTPDKAAPLLSPIQWVQIQKWLKANIVASTFNFTNKRFMAMLSISFGFSTGLRLSEIHRLRYSDIDWDQKNVLKLRIRRSKSNRDGRKIVWQVAPIHQAEELLCPIRNLIWYIEGLGKSTNPESYIFSDDVEGRKLTRVNNLVNYWRLGAKYANLPEEKWPRAHSHHGAKVNLARALGYSEEAIVDSMNWQSVSVLQEYLRNKNMTQDGVAHELSSLTALELTQKTSHIW